MPTITFQVPSGFTRGNPHPFFQFNGFIPNDKLGVYVWGVKLIINGETKFCPIYVGEGWLRECLQKRHYNKNANYGGHVKELFDLVSLQRNSGDFYKRVLKLYNTVYMAYYPAITPGIQGAMLNLLAQDLVYFHSQTHMNMYCLGVPYAVGVPNHNHYDALINYNALSLMGNIRASDLCTRFVLTKNIISCSFFFVYTTLDKIKDDNPTDFIGMSDSTLKKRVEHATKKALENISLFTAGKGEGEILDMNIDFTAIQNDLINVGDYVYPNNYGIAGDPPLVIPVPNYPPYY